MLKITRLTRPGELKEWLEDTAKEGVDTVALDFETTGLSRTDKIISGAVTGPTPYDIAFFDDFSIFEIIAAPSGMKFIFHNATFDLKMLAWATGTHLAQHFDYEDTLILSHLLDENGSHSLGDLVEQYYGDTYKKDFWSKHKKATDAPESELAQYNALDVHYTFKLHRDLKAALKDDGVPDSLIEHVHSLQKTLLETEIQGIAVDKEYLLEKGTELRIKIERLLPEMRTLVAPQIDAIECADWIKEIEKRKTPAGKSRVPRPEFSFDSPKQLAALIYDQLKLPKQINAKTKAVSTDWDSLENVKELHPVVSKLQEYREAQKIYGTYIEGTLERMVEGRIYPSFNVTGTATGRISHQNPNMGNMPSGGGIRGMFIPDSGHVLISADFSQLEVCLSAHFTSDANLLRIVNEGASQHDITAASLGIPRGSAKNVNFACQYGAGAFKLAKMLGVSNEQGEKALAKYWETYAGQKRVMDECSAKVDRGEPIISPFGRRRRFETRQRKAWDGAYRQAWNALVQGTGSDCTSRAFYLADAGLRNRGIGRALFTVHDEIIIQAKIGHEEEAEKVLVDTMAAVGVELNLTVALKAQGSGACSRWED